MTGNANLIMESNSVCKAFYNLRLKPERSRSSKLCKSQQRAPVVKPATQRHSQPASSGFRKLGPTSLERIRIQRSEVRRQLFAGKIRKARQSAAKIIKEQPSSFAGQRLNDPETLLYMREERQIRKWKRLEKLAAMETEKIKRTVEERDNPLEEEDDGEWIIFG